MAGLNSLEYSSYLSVMDGILTHKFCERGATALKLANTRADGTRSLHLQGSTLLS